MRKICLLFSLISSIPLCAQTNQWTWVSGDKTVNSNGIYGTQGVAGPANMPGARISSISWTDASGVLWLFGGNGLGQSGAGVLNDLWKFNASGLWTWVGGSKFTLDNGFYG